MLRMALRRGLKFLEGAKKFVLERRLANGKIRFEQDDGNSLDLTESEFHRRWSSEGWHVDEESLGSAADVYMVGTPALLEAYDKRDQAIARKREQYLLRIERLFIERNERFVSTPERLQPLIEVVAEQLEDKSPPSTDSVWRWSKRYFPTRCATRLIDRRSPGRPSLLKVFSGLFDEAVEEIYLTTQKLPVGDVIERLRTKIAAFNVSRPAERHVQEPSKATVYRWVNRLYGPVVLAARQGKRVAEREFRSVVSGLKVKRILDRWELDHTPLDIILICKTTKLILGRPTLTVCIDRRSRMIVGFYLSFQAPSATSVLHCLRQAILPKESVLARFPDIRGPWPARGLPTAVAVDNGMDLHAKDLEEPALELGIELYYMGAGYPELKAAIERVIGTINRTFIHKLPGTTFSNVQERGDYPSEQLAVLDIETLTHVLLKWIVDIYHKTPHRGLKGRTPLQVWTEGEATRVIELPAYPRQLDLIVGHSATPTIWHYGIAYDNLHYNSARLKALREEDVDVVQIRAHETSVAFVSVLDPKTKEYFDVPAVDTAYVQDLTRHVHRLVMQEVRKRFKDDWSATERLQVKREIQVIVEEAIRDKKMATRKSAARAMAVDSAEVFNAREASAALDSALDAAEKARAADGLTDEVGDDELPNYATQEREVVHG